MREQERTALNRFFTRGSPHPEVVSVYLFGSHAEGRTHNQSDVDLGVLLDINRMPTARERFEARVKLGSELSSVLGENQIDLLILNDIPPLLGRKIVCAGIQIFCSAPEEDLAFVRDVQLKAADLQPFLQRMRKLKLEALAR